MRLFSFSHDALGGFVRVPRNGRGLSWTCMRPLFSERNGFRTPFARVGKWRLFWLSK